jgi:predicted AAA+ superfamily ATPase
MIQRKRELRMLYSLLGRHPVVGIIGARQVGKTTLARQLVRAVKGQVHYFDLENPEDLARLSEPMLALKRLEGLAVIDEIQCRPDLFPVLRVLVDRSSRPLRFLVLGSASPSLLAQGSETLAGRIVYHELSGLALDEVGAKQHLRLWLRGGLPRAYLARTQADSHEWRRGFIRTFLERDLGQLGITIRSVTMNRFWSMLAHCHGQVWNASEFARSFGVADTTVRRYLDLMTSAIVVRQLQPWHENISKRQVKAPKIFLADSGVLHALLNLRTMSDLEAHPKVGASWEGFVIEQLVRRLGVRFEECFFWATHAGAELDLMVMTGRKRLGFEIKRTSSPRMSASTRSALSDLKLSRLDIIHAGEMTFSIAKNVRAVSLTRMLRDIDTVG